MIDMAHMWTRSGTASSAASMAATPHARAARSSTDPVGPSWIPMRLDDGEAFSVGEEGVRRLSHDAPLNRVTLVRSEVGARATWALLVPHGQPVRVNGATPFLGIVVLADRDEVRVGGGPAMFFSTETLATVMPFPATGPKGFCPRCKQRIDAGTPAAACPGCGLWYHQSETLPCWTYGEQCAGCLQATALDAGFSWTPEEVDQ